MSSPERRLLPVGLALASLGLALAGCTEFRPMYADPAVLGSGSADIGRALARVRVAPIEDRYGVELRNDLIFELTGGGVEPAQADLELSIRISRSAGNLAVEAISGRPTSAQLILSANYRLTRISNGNVVATGSVVSRVPYDQTVQRFANLRAQRDAEDRAAREIAVLIRNAIASQVVNPRAEQPAPTPAAPGTTRRRPATPAAPSPYVTPPPHR